ncbi:hypothetical protein ACFV1Y_28730, partial [Streptomyces werraensis]
MNEREILTRFKAGTLEREQAARLLAAAAGTARPPAVARPDTPHPPPAATGPHPPPTATGPHAPPAATGPHLPLAA